MCVRVRVCVCVCGVCARVCEQGSHTCWQEEEEEMKEKGVLCIDVQAYLSAQRRGETVGSERSIDGN